MTKKTSSAATSAQHITVINMGCSKNLVDSERLAGQLEALGFKVDFDREPPRGSVVVVNTCGFIGDAKEESVLVLLKLAEQRRRRRIRGLYAMGCLTERYRDELREEIPELDGIYGKFDWTGIVEAIRDKGNHAATEKLPECGRKLSTPPYQAYIKISEGCNRFCAYCAIPLITGRIHSRTIDDIEAEVKALVADGVREFNIICQDLSSYGRDLPGASAEPLAELLERLAVIPGVEMIRLHYAYPADFPYGILPVMARHDNICKYLDIALQHIDDEVLTAMRRHIDAAGTRELLARIRREVPGIHLRTTMMVGFPGETDEAFRNLLDFVQEARFERLGAFTYSEEEGTYAAQHLPDTIPAEVKQERLEELLALQDEIAAEIQQQEVGRTLRVIIDAKAEDGHYFGRTEFDSPDVDYIVNVSSSETLQPGDIRQVLITGCAAYGLDGVTVS
ncbi:MAG: 30S ribosomal protein S12 methylthiotransferase RimO [Muribaculaceae bacterium]|nr:30S ribosomal protein S12 methylthiotransferase RimO [Muribaculaceae bacterium]